MGLFKPAWMGTNKEKALASVAKLTDKEKLARAAMNAPLDEVCVVAARRLMSRHYEGFLTVLYKAPRVRALLAIVEWLSSVNEQIALKFAATDAPFKEVSMLAVEKLSGLHDTQEYLKEIAVRASFDETREIAIKHIQGIDALEELSRKYGDNPVIYRNLMMRAMHIFKEMNTDERRLYEQAVGDIFLKGLSHISKEKYSFGDGETFHAMFTKMMLDVAACSPTIIKRLWPGITQWAVWSTHTDIHAHKDAGNKGPHSDSYEYYDFFRYPDGRTEPNRQGRRKHTDYYPNTISNDCHVNPHSDNPRGVHTDNNRKNEILYRFPSFVEHEEKTAKTETAAATAETTVDAQPQARGKQVGKPGNVPDKSRKKELRKQYEANKVKDGDSKK